MTSSTKLSVRKTLKPLGLKKSCRHLTYHEKVSLIERDNPDLSLVSQTKILGISRSSLYYTPQTNEADIEIMNLIDEIYTKYPFYGSRRIKNELEYYYKVKVSRKRIVRLMRKMGIEAIYPKINTSKPNLKNKIYPYLLRNLTIHRPNQVWGTDITYIRLDKGFCYLTAILDWFSRYVVAWELSNSLEIDFVIDNIEKALKADIPEIHNSDQGSHFTSNRYMEILEKQNIKISMDGRGRCMDNIFTERLWRTVKYENIYIKSYPDAGEARKGLKEYFDFYNNHRLHQSLKNKTPKEVYFQ